jgi:hypothetical protein
MRAIVHTHATNIFAATIAFRTFSYELKNEPVVTIPENRKNCLIQIDGCAQGEIKEVNLSFNTVFVDICGNNNLTMYCAPCGQQWFQSVCEITYLIGHCRNLVTNASCNVKYRSVDNLICRMFDETDVFPHADTYYDDGYCSDEYPATMFSGCMSIDNVNVSVVHANGICGNTTHDWVPVGRSEFTELVQWRMQQNKF